MTKKQTYHHGDLRDQLMAKALEHLQKNDEKLSLRAIARELGVSQAAPYRHFKDRNALLAALATDGFTVLTKMMQDAMQEQGGRGKSAIQFCGMGYIDFARKNPEKFRLMFGRDIVERPKFPDLLEASEISFNVLLTVVEQRNRKSSEKKIKMEANTAWALVHGLSTLIIDRLDQQMSEELIQEQIKFSTQTLI